ncbi:unnamed protein product [Lepeophtheirus salmonis]|uniref:(salmon louse) hypothetical protein n=1 Tax=Lepeophtheirus salmonis TaxID=72036 RepID=A0A7R8CS84_LEPSM|nr:unnamed protein product [Lepeophtheirus salmonis]CAF2862275.1 unnamed protein product [Lepeophtheirus salmonis]
MPLSNSATIGGLIRSLGSISKSGKLVCTIFVDGHSIRIDFINDITNFFFCVLKFLSCRLPLKKNNHKSFLKGHLPITMHCVIFFLKNWDSKLISETASFRVFIGCTKLLNCTITMGNFTFTSFICLLLSMTMGEYSTLESDKHMDPMERLETPSKLEDERMNRESEMILCGHNLFNAWRIACSSIGFKEVTRRLFRRDDDGYERLSKHYEKTSRAHGSMLFSALLFPDPS